MRASLYSCGSPIAAPIIAPATAPGGPPTRAPTVPPMTTPAPTSADAWVEKPIADSADSAATMDAINTGFLYMAAPVCELRECSQRAAGDAIVVTCYYNYGNHF